MRPLTAQNTDLLLSAIDTSASRWRTFATEADELARRGKQVRELITRGPGTTVDGVARSLDANSLVQAMGDELERALAANVENRIARQGLVDAVTSEYRAAGKPLVAELTAHDNDLLPVPLVRSSSAIGGRISELAQQPKILIAPGVSAIFGAFAVAGTAGSATWSPAHVAAVEHAWMLYDGLATAALGAGSVGVKQLSAGRIGTPELLGLAGASRRSLEREGTTQLINGHAVDRVVRALPRMAERSRLAALRLDRLSEHLHASIEAHGVLMDNEVQVREHGAAELKQATRERVTEARALKEAQLRAWQGARGQITERAS